MVITCELRQTSGWFNRDTISGAYKCSDSPTENRPQSLIGIYYNYFNFHCSVLPEASGRAVPPAAKIPKWTSTRIRHKMKIMWQPTLCQTITRYQPTLCQTIMRCQLTLRQTIMRCQPTLCQTIVRCQLTLRQTIMRCQPILCQTIMRCQLTVRQTIILYHSEESPIIPSVNKKGEQP